MRRGVGRTGSMIHGADCCVTGLSTFFEVQETGTPFQRSPVCQQGTEGRAAGRRRAAVRRSGEEAGRRRRGRPIPYRGGRPFHGQRESVRQRWVWAKPP